MNQKPTILLMGAAGSGKGTQAKRIKEKYGYDIVEAGAILRALAKTESDLALRVKAIIESGDHLTDEMVTEILHDYISKTEHGGALLIDGYPRSLGQAELLKGLLTEAGMDPENLAVISIEVAREVSEDRLMNREEGGRRKDDNPEGIKKRLDYYFEKIVPVVEHYKSLDKVIVIDGEKSIDDVFVEIDTHLDQIISKEN